jgi:hypothetical protein
MKGFVHEEALAEYSRLVAEKLNQDFAEGDVYDFGRCMRPDGSFYGTRGKCRKGSEAGEKVESKGQLKGAGESLRAKAEEKGRESIRREFAAAAKDYKSRIDDLKDELKRGDADPKAIKKQIEMWQSKLRFAAEKAKG